MSAKQKKLLWPLMIALAVISTGFFWASAVMKTSASAHIASVTTPQSSPSPQINTIPRGDRSRIGRQPEAIKLSRLLGKRFQSALPDQSILVGTLIAGSEQQSLSLSRTPGATRERIEAVLGNGSTRLTWTEQEGALSSGNPATSEERLLIERLSLDSPDHFLLAQLNGASYYTVGRNIRPTEIGDADGYTGPTWDIVRVGEPQSSNMQSRWRLYYINTATGLIDKIISEEQGQQVVADLSAWTEVNGEKLPSTITWSRQGQVVMQFNLTNFSHSKQ